MGRGKWSKAAEVSGSPAKELWCEEKPGAVHWGLRQSRQKGADPASGLGRGGQGPVIRDLWGLQRPRTE